MNLKNLFNFKYFIQNLKKSKVTLAFVLLLLPILNLIVFFMTINSNTINVLDLSSISRLAIIGMYIVPIILSITLFQYIFKKKSIDFIGSMPLSRKTIFFTNTLGGMIIIIALILITAILMGIGSLFLSNVYLHIGILLDFFILYTFSYIFVFTISNLALTFSGNIVTTLLVTMILAFFIPFHDFYITNLRGEREIRSYSYHYEDYKYKNEYKNLLCSPTDKECLEKIDDDNYSVYLYEINNNYKYTLPSEVILGSTSGEEIKLYDNFIIGKMILLSCFYILIGYYLFSRKELEVSETSFKTLRMHQIVKSLTLIPIFFVMLYLLDNNFIVWLFALTLVLIYNFTYDLITRRSITKIPQNILWFITVFIFTASMYYCLTNINLNQDVIFSSRDVESLEVDLSDFMPYGDGKTYRIKDESLKTELLNQLVNMNGNLKELETNLEQDENDLTEDPIDSDSDSDNKVYLKLKLTLKNKKLGASISVDEELYRKVELLIKKDNYYNKESIQKLINSSFIVTLGHDYVTVDKEGIDLLKSVLKDKVEGDDLFFNLIDIYVYENHELKSYEVLTNVDSRLQEYAISRYNSKFNNLSDREKSNIKRLYFTRETGEGSDYYQAYTPKKIEHAIQMFTKSLDFNKPIYKVYIYIDDKQYQYYTNMTDELSNYLSSGD